MAGKKKTILVFHIIAIINFCKNTLAFYDYTVNTNSGLVKGKLNEFKGFHYYSFEGIPYAENTAGENRFKPPVPKKSWSHILDATRNGPVCPQMEIQYKRNQMSEDCLNLNIYVPTNITKSLPIFVYIHGGGHFMSSGNTELKYGPQYLLQKDIIFVTMNYRLHAFGFLSLNTQDACGNSGLKDVILSLKWIKQNLQYFGGDTSRITVGGQSSGATLTNLLMLSTNTNGLFQQAVLLCSFAFSPRGITRHPEETAFVLGKRLGIKGNDSTTLLNRLRQMNAFEITDAFEQMYKNNANILAPYSAFVPSIDKMCAQPSVEDVPAKMLENRIPQVPILIGHNSNEGAYMLKTIFNHLNEVEKLKKDLETLIPTDIQYPPGSKEAKELAKAITYFYFGKYNIADDEFCFMCLIDYLTDISYGVYSNDAWIRKYKKQSNSKNLYLYEFGFDGMLNWAKIAYGLDSTGAIHADELGYLFRTKSTKPFLDKLDSRSKKMLVTMTDFLTDFVKYGNPTPSHSNNDMVWSEYGKEAKFLNINDNLRVMRRGTTVRTAKFNFWNKVYEDYFSYVNGGGKMTQKPVQ
ncbi:juvenile hormone esterase-like [Pieris brassicae]|uniref:juvenile hormone esterase-like n=1 Tax=Pieris brassicae TaxID=7116 RepID=UPI001E662411|nr:juvenile hormone esterase-like [Pieris brassicae]